MLKWALLFVVLAIAASVLGFGGLSHGLADAAKVLLFVFLVFLSVSGLLFLFGVGRRS
jgi:uncharacterized membrane protein YtjA (UPF0391 family)